MAPTGLLLLPLPEAVDVGLIGGHDSGLVCHHAKGEEAKEDGAHCQREQGHALPWRVHAGGCCPRGEAGPEVPYHEADGIHADDIDVEQEEQEELVVGQAHAVVHPGAVVVWEPGGGKRG
jgi:hypothetical protein